MTEASPGVIVFTTAGIVAAVYAFICHIRAERVARVAVNRVRDTRPGAWHSVVANNWLLRVADPAITIRVLRARHDVSDPQFDDHFQRVQDIERREYRAVAAAFVCIAVVLIGTRYWGWTW